MIVELCTTCLTYPRLSYEQAEYKLMCDCGISFYGTSLHRVLIGWNITQQLKEKDLNPPTIPAMLETQQ
jgi:hypothetical protein